MYKLLLLDLDGTLLTDDKKISQEDLTVLRALYDEGLEIVLATGRRYYSAKHYGEIFGRYLPIIANNGNIVRDSFDDKLLLKTTLAYKDIEVLARIGMEKGLHPIFHVDGYQEGYDILMEAHDLNPDYDFYFHAFGDRARFLRDLSQLKAEDVLAMVYMAGVGVLKDLEEKMKESAIPLESHVVGNMVRVEGMLELMAPGGTKWQAAQTLARLKGIREDEIIAIGDDVNDLSMIRGAGLGIAMCNGHPELMEVADRLSLDDNNASGVSKTILDVLGK